MVAHNRYFAIGRVADGLLVGSSSLAANAVSCAVRYGSHRSSRCCCAHRAGDHERSDVANLTLLCAPDPAERVRTSIWRARYAIEQST